MAKPHPDIQVAAMVPAPIVAAYDDLANAACISRSEFVRHSLRIAHAVLVLDELEGIERHGDLTAEQERVRALATDDYAMCLRQLKPPAPALMAAAKLN